MPDVTLFDIADLFGTDPPPDEPVSDPEPVEVGESTPTSDDLRNVAAVPDVVVRISKRRKKTSEAKWVGGRIVVSVPAHLDRENRQKTIDWLVERLLTRQPLQSGLDNDGLLARAIDLSDRYLIGARPESVRWVTNQSARWGSCSYYSGQIRISHRLRVVPGWVLDSVLVHEVAHLTHPDHSRAFHKLAGAFPRHQEAGVFLAGYGLGLSNPTPPLPDSAADQQLTTDSARMGGARA